MPIQNILRIKPILQMTVSGNIQFIVKTDKIKINDLAVNQNNG